MVFLDFDVKNMSCQMEMLAGDSSGSAVVGGAQSGGAEKWGSTAKPLWDVWGFIEGSCRSCKNWDV